MVSTLGLVGQHVPLWDVAFFAEFDAYGNEHHIDLQCEHLIRRHYPGLGAWAMAIIIHHSITHLVRSISSRGRCMAVHLFQRTASAEEVISLFIVGIHNSHGDAQIDTLADAAFLVRKRPRGSKVVVIGDFNVDQLPSLQSDPFQDTAQRGRHHIEERVRLEGFADGLELHLHIPEVCTGLPGGPYAQHCLFAPISRVPVGDSAALCLPSLLDYALASRDAIKACFLFGEGVPADHALIGLVVGAKENRKRSLKKTWQCNDEDACVLWLHQNCPDKFTCVEEVRDFASLAQAQFDDQLTCAQSRRLRLPLKLRELYGRLSATTSEAERRRLQREAWELRKSWVAAFRTRRMRDCIAKGRVLSRSKKLYPLHVLVDDDGSRQEEGVQWELALHKYFGQKWGAKNESARAQLMSRILHTDGGAVEVPCESLDAAFQRIRQKRRLDIYGTSVGALLLLWRACPLIFRCFIASFIASASMVSSLEVHGRVLGKESSVSPVSKLRAILPLPALLQVADALLPILLERHLTTVLPSAPGCLVAGRPFTQVLDITHGLQSVLEKGLDEFGAAAVAQCDIQQYYDSLPLLRIFLWLIDKGVPAILVAAALRHQVCPQVVLVAGSARVPIMARCIGGLTGSRVAGVLARIPVESSLAARAGRWKKWGFGLTGVGGSGVTLCCASYVDNCFAVSRTPAGAVKILEDLELTLQTEWDLRMKPSSRSYVEAYGGCRGVVDEQKWPRDETFHALGHCIQHTGSIREDWSKTRRQMWKAFWANAGSAGASKLKMPDRLRLLLRAVVPILDFKCSRWPPQATIAAELDAVQRKMVATVLRLQPWPDETFKQFSQRRGRAARHLCAQIGVWSRRWFQRVLNWDAHVRRDRNSLLWSAQLVDYKGRAHLAERRAFNNGRTGTRAHSGYPCRRWHDGVAYARSCS